VKRPSASSHGPHGPLGDARASGVLLHPSSLRGPHGIGDLGAEALRFVEFLAAAKQRYWQMLPIHPLGAGNSPYSALSAFAGCPLFIDLDALVEDDLLDASELGPALPQAKVDYRRAEQRRLPLLRAAFTRFSRRPRRYADELQAFRHEARFWLPDYALFMALRGALGQPSWLSWPAELRARERAALRGVRRQLSDQIAYYEFEQWLFSRQWRRLRAHAAAHALSLIGDIPIFVAHESADVWANQHIFQLDRAGRPRFVSGVPPDYFSSEGQRWGTPLYDWHTLKQEGYRFWIERLKSLAARFDLVRLDHFIGFVRAWHIPRAAPSAKVGRFHPGPKHALFAEVTRALGRLPFIAEDLGALTPEVEALRDALRLPGMRVLQFAFGSDAENPFLPHNYPRHSVAYSGTHDNDTLLGFLRHSSSAAERSALRAYLGMPKAARDDALCDALLALLYSSQAQLCIVPMQDLLKLDSDARMNLPGKAEGNWTFRLPARGLSVRVAERLRGLTVRTGRAG
jgi:4-alpha-glucanotransferase